MKITVFGGSGYVGGYLIDELLDKGHHPVLLVRPESRHKVRHHERCTLVDGDIASPDSIRAAIYGADAAIYNIGILREFPCSGVTYEALHFEGAKHAMDAAEEAGVRRFLLMSANGVKADGTGYQRTKYMAEQYLKSTGLDWTVFRPSVLFGEPRGRIEFATQLYRNIVRSPLPAPLFYEGLMPFNAGEFRMSPVHVKDVASVFTQALEMPDTAGQIFALCGPASMSWKEILKTIAAAAGTTKHAFPAPVLLLKGLASALDQFEIFPVTRDQLTMLMEGNTCDRHNAFQSFDLEPTPFDTLSLSYLQREGETV